MASGLVWILRSAWGLCGALIFSYCQWELLALKTHCKTWASKHQNHGLIFSSTETVKRRDKIEALSLLHLHQGLGSLPQELQALFLVVSPTGNNTSGGKEVQPRLPLCSSVDRSLCCARGSPPGICSAGQASAVWTGLPGTSGLEWVCCPRGAPVPGRKIWMVGLATQRLFLSLVTRKAA